MNVKTIFKHFHDHSYVANEICTVYGEKAFYFHLQTQPGIRNPGGFFF